MAQYWIDFSDFPLGVEQATDEIEKIPSGADWSYEIVEDAASIGGRVLRTLSIGDTIEQIVLKFLNIDPATDYDVIARLKPTASQGSAQRLYCRLTSGLDTSFFTEQSDRSGGNKIRKLLDGSPSDIAESSRLTTVNEWTWVRYQCTGLSPTTLQTKGWQGDIVTDEPSGWALSTTDGESVLQQAGGFGVGFANFGVQDDHEYDVIAIGTDGDPAPTEPVGVEAEDHTAVATQVFPAPLQSASATHIEPESHTATASQVFPAPLQSATATHAEPENHTANASQVFPAPIQSATVTHSSVEGNSASATQVFPAPLQSATATHAAPENHSASATQVFPAPLQSAVATHTAAASNTATATQIFPAPLQSAVATHVAPESHTATATQVFPAPIQAAAVVHSDRELKPPVRARISSAQRFTSNTSTSERIQ